MVFVITWVVLCMFLWFNTDAFQHYFKWVPFLKIKDYENYTKISSGRIKYPDFLFLQSDNFFTKLISCKPCLCFWLSAFFHFLFSIDLIEFPLVYLGSYIVYKLLDRYLF
jgi:hypothetical protein